MSVEAQVAKLESLLERIQQNRKPLPSSGGAEAVAAEPVRSAQPTPMERALESELVQRDEPEVLITVDEDEPEITIEAEAPEAPTAPIGTRAPTPTPHPAPTAPAAAQAPAQVPTPAPRTPVSAPKEAAAGPEPVSFRKPSGATSPVARVTATATPRTFGEMIARTLALRPR